MTFWKVHYNASVIFSLYTRLIWYLWKKRLYFCVWSLRNTRSSRQVFAWVLDRIVDRDRDTVYNFGLNPNLDRTLKEIRVLYACDYNFWIQFHGNRSFRFHCMTSKSFLRKYRYIWFIYNTIYDNFIQQPVSSQVSSDSEGLSSQKFFISVIFIHTILWFLLLHFLSSRRVFNWH